MIAPALAKVLRICAIELDRLAADWAVSGATALANAEDAGRSARVRGFQPV